MSRRGSYTEFAESMRKLGEIVRSPSDTIARWFARPKTRPPFKANKRRYGK